MAERKDEEILKEIRDRYKYASQAWKPIREEAQKDMRFISGDAWEAKDRKAREDAGRPCISLDELGQYVNQTVNDVRQNKRGIKVTALPPASAEQQQGGQELERAAEVGQSLIRQIEYRSNAQDAYTTMFENTVQRSYGFLRIKAKYVDDRGFDQELVIEAIQNPDLVTVDPDGLAPDGSDIQYAFIQESQSIKQFERNFPDAEVKSFTDEHQALAPEWVKGERIMVAEYWTIEYKRRTLLLLQGANGPQAIFEDEVPKDAIIPKEALLKSRIVEQPYVCQYLTNGVELLTKAGSSKKTEWRGRSIPLVACYGKVLYLDLGAGTERRVLSLIRLARDPQMLYCYYRTCQAELVGITPKTPFIGYKGQFAGVEEQWQKANHEPVAYLEAEPTTERTGQSVLPLPQRQPYDPPIQSLEMGAEGARRAIQAAMGITPLPTSAQRRNEKSGIALQHIEDSAQRGSYHFVDHYDAAIRRTGQILDELVPHYYDAARTVTVRKPDDTAEMLRINDPSAEKPVDLTKSRNDVTISVGPAMASQREAAETFADTLAGNPAVFPIVADLVVKLKNLGPIGDEIAERLTPPQFQKKDGPPSPAQVAMLQQQLQQMQEALQQAQQFIETEQAKQQAIIEKSRIEAERDLKLEEMRGQVELLKAEIEARAKGLAADKQAGLKVTDIAARALEAERDRQAEAELEASRADRADEQQQNEHAHAAGMAAHQAANNGQE